MRLRSRAFRRKSRLIVHFWRPGLAVEYGEGRVGDLSATGLFIITPDPLPPPTEVQLSVLVGGKAVETTGEVVRSMGGGGHQHHSRSGMGVRFTKPASPAVREILATSPDLETRARD